MQAIRNLWMAQDSALALPRMAHFCAAPAEAAFHQAQKNDLHELYFMCDVLKATMEPLKGKKVKSGPVREERWDSLTTISLPGGGKVGLYQPKHPSAIRR